MSQCQILLPPPTLKNTIDDVALMPYKCPESAFNFEGWQEGPQSVLPSLLPHSSLSAAATPSAESNPEAVIHCVPPQFQP